MKYANRINGFLAINKPYGKTSRDVVNEVQKIFNTKAGHTGTLDPIATGVLIVCLGKYTKLSSYITSDKKKYIATVKFGISTDTLDVTGNMLDKNDIIPSKECVTDIINKFICSYEQEVPIYSAVKISGRKLYEYARDGVSVDLPKRLVTIYSLKLISYNKNGFTFSCEVSKGTYIRSLIKDMCEAMGCLGVMDKLERTEQCGISVDECFSLDDIKNNNYKFMDIDDIMDVDMRIVNDSQKIKILNGVKQAGKCHTLFLDSNYNRLALYKYNGNDLEMWVKLYEA